MNSGRKINVVALKRKEVCYRAYATLLKRLVMFCACSFAAEDSSKMPAMIGFSEGEPKFVVWVDQNKDNVVLHTSRRGNSGTTLNIKDFELIISTKDGRQSIRYNTTDALTEWGSAGVVGEISFPKTLDGNYYTVIGVRYKGIYKDIPERIDTAQGKNKK